MTSGTWQIRPTGQATTLVYRSQFTSHAPDLLDQAAEHFARWANTKGVTVSPAALRAGDDAEATDPDGTHRRATGMSGSWTEPHSGRRLDTLRLRLDETLSTGATWRTTVTVAVPDVCEQPSLLASSALTPDRGPLASISEPATLFHDRSQVTFPGQAWGWLDLDHRPAAGGPPVRPGSPRLIRDLLAAVEGVDGSVPLTSDILNITESHVDEVCGWLFDQHRRVPIIVFTPDPEQPEQQERFAETLARDVAGVAAVVSLVDATTAAAFCRRVGTHLQVYGGAMRTYLPGLQPLEPFPRRHRVLSAATMRIIGRRSANPVRDQVLGLSTRRTPPASYPLVQRALARGSAKRHLADQRRAARPAAPPRIQPSRTQPPLTQPPLFPHPNVPTLPGIDDAIAESAAADTAIAKAAAAPHPAPAEQTTPPTQPAPTQPAPVTQPVSDRDARSATHEANESIRAALAFAGIDTTVVARRTPTSDAADFADERRQLERLLAETLSAASRSTEDDVKRPGFHAAWLLAASPGGGAAG